MKRNRIENSSTKKKEERIMKRTSYVMTAHLGEVGRYWSKLNTADSKIVNIETIKGINDEDIVKITYEWEDGED